jgi:hypothetical protein
MPAFFLLNTKRSELSRLEAEHGVQILILPDGRLRPDEYAFEMEGVRQAAAVAPPAPAPEKASRAKRNEEQEEHQAAPAK